MDWDLNNDISYSHTFTLKAHYGNKCKFQTKGFRLLFWWDIEVGSRNLKYLKTSSYFYYSDIVPKVSWD